MGEHGRAYRARVAIVCSAVLLAAACGGTSSKGLTTTTTAATASSTTSTTAAGGSSTSAGPTTSSPPTTAAPGGTVVIGLDSDPPSLDPAGNSLSFANGAIYSAIMETLLSVKVGGTPQAALATGVTEAPDRLSWTIALRPDVTFQDGTKLDADAVKFNLERQRTSLYNGPSLRPVTAVDVVDPLHVKLTISTPWVALPYVLAGVDGLMVSPTAVQKEGANFGRSPVGTGPYTFKEWIPNDHITVVRNTTYWGQSITGGAKLDSQIYKIIPDETARYAALKAGDIQAMTTVLDDSAATAKNDGFQVIKPPVEGYGMSLLNNTKAPLNDVRVRQALDLSVDRDAIAKAFQGQGYADFSFGPFPKDNPWYVAPETTPTFNPAGAKVLLQQYGKPVKFTYKVVGGTQFIIDEVNAFANYWKKVGIDVTVQVIPDATQFVTQVVLGQYDAASWVGGVTADPDSMLYELFHTGGASNYEKYSDTAMDAALELGRTSADDSVRHQAYGTAQQILRKDMPVYLASFGVLYVVAAQKVTGLDPNTYFMSTYSMGLS
jgi:ABC-type transport system substrate-binding protein